MCLIIPLQLYKYYQRHILPAGVKIKYAVEATAGTRPTSGYKVLPDIKEVPEMNPEPETLETTTLSDTDIAGKPIALGWPVKKTDFSNFGCSISNQTDLSDSFYLNYFSMLSLLIIKEFQKI